MTRTAEGAQKPGGFTQLDVRPEDLCLPRVQDIEALRAPACQARSVHCCQPHPSAGGPRAGPLLPSDVGRIYFVLNLWTDEPVSRASESRIVVAHESVNQRLGVHCR